MSSSMAGEDIGNHRRLRHCDGPASLRDPSQGRVTRGVGGWQRLCLASRPPDDYVSENCPHFPQQTLSNPWKAPLSFSLLAVITTPSRPAPCSCRNSTT